MNLKLVSVSLTAALGGTALLAIPVPRDQLQQFQSTQHSAIRLEGIHKIKLKLAVAQVHVITDSSTGLDLRSLRWASSTAPSNVKEWVNKGDLVITRSGGQIILEDSPLRAHSLNQMTGSGHEELILRVPKGLDLDVSLGGGMLVTKGSYRSIASKVGAGQLMAQLESTPSIKSSFDVESGNVQISLPPSANAVVAASVGFGQISGIPASVLKSKEPKFGDMRTAVLGGGQTPIDVHVGSGDIQLEDSNNAHATLALDNERWDNSAAQGFAKVSQQKEDEDSDENSATDTVKLGEIDEEVQDALKQAQPDIDASMQKVSPDIDREVQRELDKIGPEIKKAMAMIKPEIERALRQAGPEIKKARREHPKEFAHEIARIKPEIKRAMEEAMKGMKQAEAEMDRKEIKELQKNSHLRDTIKEALKAAREAMKDAFTESQKATDHLKD